VGAIRSIVVSLLPCLLALAAAGCGGGGGGGSSSVLPPAPVSPSTPGSSAPTAVAFTIAIPTATASSARRAPRYVSAATKSLVVTTDNVHAVVNCTTVCSGTLQMTPGTHTFSLALYDALDGAGHVLSSGTTSAAIVAGQPNTVLVTFGGVVASVSVAVTPATLRAGTPADAAVAVVAKDAAGYAIVGSDAFAQPIVLANADASGATSLSTTAVTSPSTAVTLHYTGASMATTQVTASVPGTSVAAGSATVSVATATPPPTPAPTATPAPTPVPTAAPAGSFPDHVRTHAYYGLNNVNASIPAAYMAAHVDIVEDDGFTAQHALAFKQAGGSFAMAYTDPMYVPYCAAPFTEPAGACSGPIGNLVQNDRTAWVHDASGARIHRANASGTQYQEMLNVASASAQSAYAKTTQAILQANPLLDGFEADDSGGTFTVDGRGLGSNYYSGFGTGVDIASEAAFVAGETAMFGAAGRPVMVNGSSPQMGPAYNGAFVDLPSVFGQQFEGYVNNDGGYLYAGGQFAQEENGVLAVQAHRKWAMMMPSGSTTPSNRLYAYAAFLLVYDPNYSVYNMEVKQSDGYSLYPETQLVPAQPAATANGDVAQLQRGGVYVREFGACAIAAQPIGPCAVVLNAGSSSAATPSLSTAYAHQIALDAASLYTGGKARVVSGTPASLGATTAAILVR
jgi:hypothetical protein